ncbi:Phosphoenolpyruvate carboxykinase GTP [Fasciola hepatica]|uniref:phosphoenolpyruvate carboxykinase (GTP) n=1 Tax=Fasciola hepatica TaxID=6192 RepID=A0A2H1CEU3_FASHE|nr:Phosphoenolpyruvate carboxykinase GTP [Fasciola hepatica]
MSLWQETSEKIVEVHEIVVPKLGSVPVTRGNFAELPLCAQTFIGHWLEVCQPTSLHICDGSVDEGEKMVHQLREQGVLTKLTQYHENYLCRTDPKDVARVESKTFICTPNKYDVVPHLPEGVKGVLGQWISPDDLNKALSERLPGCMKGRPMYAIPFSMGPVGSPLGKVGIELTDSSYVALCMRIMTRVNPKVWDIIQQNQDYVRCVHSVGFPLPSERPIINHWPCNPEKTIISHIPDEKTIISYGSGYGGNSLLGKKCFALRIAGKIAHDEGWLAEHMLIMSVTNPQGQEKFIAAAFPSACGKTNMAMLEPALPGWKIQCVGDDIAWMRFNKDGVLHAINPEYGFFGVAPGTNYKTNPNAIKTCLSNTIFTNVAESEDGRFFWEGLEDEFSPETEIITWLGHRVKLSDKSHDPKSHPNSRFCCPASQCPIIHPKWEDPEGVPISAIIFGGRRPEGIPLVLQSFDWKHGVMLGAALKSEATAAAEFTGKVVMHDPMAMRPFVGYNFGKYLEHWLQMERPGRKMPLIFHVNWFRLNEQGKFVWPGFGDNIRVIDWMLRRVDGEEVGVKSPIGIIPRAGSINLEGLNVNWDSVFSLPKSYLLEDVDETLRYLEEQVGGDLPQTIRQELVNQRGRIEQNLK